MRKAFGFILTVVLAMSLIGCSDKKATTTEKVTSTEVKATATEAPTTEVPITKATVSDATATDATATDATATSASSTDATVPEASSNDAAPDDPKKSKENIVITEGLDPSFAISTVREKTDNRWIIGYCGDTVFAVIIGNEGEEHIDVNLESELETSSIMFMFSEEVADTSLYHESLYSGVQAITDGVLDFTVEFKDGKTVNITVHVPES